MGWIVEKMGPDRRGSEGTGIPAPHLPRHQAVGCVGYALDAA